MADKKCLDGTGLRTVIDWVLSKFTKKEDFEGLEIGGRNIATGTNQGINGWGWNTENANTYTKEEVIENGIRCCKFTRTSTYAGRWSVISYYKINRPKYQAGKKYTVSFEVKASVNTIFYCGLKLSTGIDDLVYSVSYVQPNTSANVWTKCIFVLTLKNQLPSPAEQMLYLNGMDSSPGVSYIFRNLMIEEGNKPTDWTPAPEDLAPANHTHNYAGASTAGGSATSAVKLDTSAGSATKPVYFSGGKPVECSYSLQKSVPADAVFTDTNTWRGIQNNLTSDSTTDSLAAAQGKALKALVDGKAASSHTHAKSDITDMPTSLPANGGNADTVDGMHASDIFKHLGLKDVSEVSPNERGCFSVNLVGTSLGWLNVVQLEQGHFISQLGFEINSYYNTGTVWARSRYANNSFADWNSGWHRLGIDVVIGTSTGTIAYKSGYTKAVVEFWKTTVGSASRTVYDAALITGLSSSMTASTPSAISSGQDFAFALGNDASGGIIITGNFTKYKITYFN